MSTHFVGLSIGVLFVGAITLRRINERTNVARWAALLSVIAFGLVTTSALSHLFQVGQSTQSTHDPISLALSWAATLALVSVSLASPRADLTAERISRSFALVALF
ncbi:MAG: hypothetical protein IPK82_00935 [Polyangiaceae bacterium]|nr:hypothetical protein [Polyangiaceae bacterium]